MSAPATEEMSAVEAGQMSALETRKMSAAETGQMSAVETRQMSTFATGRCPVLILYICLVSTADICLVSTRNVQVSEVSILAMFKSQIGGLALNRQKWLEVGPEWSPGPENRPLCMPRPFSREGMRSVRGPRTSARTKSLGHPGPGGTIALA